jgi:hypothetical protein
MNSILRRAARIVAAPDQEWRSVQAEPARPLAVMLYVLLLSLIPAAGWSTGLWLFGNETNVGRGAQISGVGQIVYHGLLAAAGFVLWVVLCAATLVALARLFGAAHDWARALQVAAYSATPVALAGLLLIQPNLLSVLIIAFFYSLYLQYAGVQHVLQVKEGAAAEYVALSTILLSVLSTAIGALGGWLGVL